MYEINGTSVVVNGHVDDRFEPARLRYFAPNFRCSGSEVEIPDGWRKRYHWDKSRQVGDAIDRLIAEHGKRGRCFEGPDNGFPRENGFRVSIGAWDATMNEIVGVNWDRAKIDDASAMALLASA